ncbi:hypothetical protein [Paludibacterium purpuratum]|uniref:Uncharacterized protein n=1 Tax=Paludibacterium purpuratum TaxID=1144873 RepID=A0A4R7AZG6_9NEIS|nr:hypothetical protein [Paludibacterium purpuratum]TDR73802.1 hypothetical protein DFP86_1126 [Paludibacterium purpuratum]
MKKFLFCLCFFSAAVLAADEVAHHASPDQSTVIEHSCGEQGCSAWVAGTSGKTMIVDEAHTQDIAVQWLNNDLADVHFSCGSPCTAHFFYDRHRGVSRPIGDVMAVDTKRLCALRPTQEGLEVVPMYGPKGPRFWQVRYNDPKYAFDTGSVVVFAGIEARFQADGGLSLNYTDRNGRRAKRLVQPKCL